MTLIDRRAFLGGSVALAGLAVAGCAGQRRSAQDRLIIDALGGIGNPNLWLEPRDPFAADAAQPPPEVIDPRALSDAQASGLTACNVTLGYVAGPYEPFEHSVAEIAWWDARIAANPDSLVKVLDRKDIFEAQRSNRIGIIYGFQNAAMMGDDASRVTTFARMGVRVIQLTYNIANQLGDGSMAPENRGLSDFGRDVIAELDNNSVLIDLSHSGEQTCLDAIAAAKGPVAITHSGCRALANLPRNKTDEELRLLAGKGGVVGIYFMPFLKVGEQPFADSVVAHIEHAVRVCGEDHVGIGTDGPVTRIDDMKKYRVALAAEVEARRKAGIGATGETADIVPFIPDLRGPDQFEKLAGMLSVRGMSSRVVDKILGENFLRIMGDTWSTQH